MNEKGIFKVKGLEKGEYRIIIKIEGTGGLLIKLKKLNKYESIKINAYLVYNNCGKGDLYTQTITIPKETIIIPENQERRKLFDDLIKAEVPDINGNNK